MVDFPFSDYSNSKKRPALVVATMTGNDILLTQITAEDREDEYILKIQNEDLKNGRLVKPSRIRANKLFTINKSVVNYKIGSLTEEKIKQVEERIIAMIRK